MSPEPVPPEAQREGQSLADIGRHLHCSTAAVAGLLHLGLKNLRKQLNELE